MRTQSVLFVLLICAGVFASGCTSAVSDPLPRQLVHVRGTVLSLSGTVLIITTATGPVAVELAAPSRVSVVIPSDRAHLKEGSYLGITSVPQSDGSIRAIEIHIFPAGAPRSGEGSYASDLSSLNSGGSTVTNGTTTHGPGGSALTYAGMHGGEGAEAMFLGHDARPQRGGTSLTLRFKSSAMTPPQSLLIPWGVPIVSFRDGRTWDLKPGAHVLVIATQNPGGDLCVDRVLVGRNGLVLSL